MGKLTHPMDQLQQFILDASLDPPLAERARHAATLADASAFATFDPKKGPCTDAQRSEMRTFLRNAGLEFDDAGWDEVLARPDVQQTLAAALMEGVVKAKNGPVTIAFMRVRARIEHTLTTPAFREPVTPPVQPNQDGGGTETKRGSPAVGEAIADAFVGNGAIDWSGIDEADRADARDALRTHVATLPDHTADWLKKIRLRFIKHEPGSPAYIIEEVNGVSARFDGLFRARRGGMRVLALPHELLLVEGSDPLGENEQFADDVDSSCNGEE